MRRLRLLFLFLRVPGKRLSLRAYQLPMWLPQANRRSIGRCAPPATLRRAGSQVKPDPSSALVVTGIYRLTRFLWILLGWVLSMNRFQIEPEERALTCLFGQTFLAYATQVRGWI